MAGAGSWVWPMPGYAVRATLKRASQARLPGWALSVLTLRASSIATLASLTVVRLGLSAMVPPLSDGHISSSQPACKGETPTKLAWGGGPAAAHPCMPQACKAGGAWGSLRPAYRTARSRFICVHLW